MPQQPIHHWIADDAHVGLGTRIWHYTVVLQGVRIGVDCNIGSNCEIGRGSVIGDHTRIGYGTFLPPNSRIGSRVFIGPSCVFTDDKHPRIPEPGDEPYDARPPVIDDYAAIGAGCVILPGVHIGWGARIGAGAVVAKDVAPHTHVRGEPARERALSAASVEWMP